MNDDVKMTPQFYGFKEVTVDTKGRVVIPKIFHASLAGDSADQSTVAGIRLSISVDASHKCLAIVTAERWESQFAALTSDKSVNRHVKRLKLSTQEWVEVGDNGRILVSKALRNLVGIEREGLISGAGSKLELWDKKAFSDYYDEIRESVREETGSATQMSPDATIAALDL